MTNMTVGLSRREMLGALSAGTGLSWLAGASEALAAVAPQYESCYRLEFSQPLKDLVDDLEHGERGNPRRESDVAHEHWYSHKVRERFGGWGPPSRRYPPLPGLADRSLTWKRERVIAAGARFIGYEYQHHHIPNWDPPAHWPWKECCAGRNGRGVDCSNFTSFVYNQGFGLKMTSAVGEQSQIHTAVEGDRSVDVRRVELPAEYAKRCAALETGDLVYIRHRENMPVSHVVIWVGGVGRSPSGVPLVLDSHGPDVVDDEGRAIPCGIHLRPFHKDSWYNRCASHAHRIFHAGNSA